MALSYTAFLLVVLVLYGGILYLSLYRTLYEDFDNVLRIKAEKLRKSLDEFMDFKRRKWIVGTEYVNIVDAKKTPVISTTNMRGRLVNDFIRKIPSNWQDKSVIRNIISGSQRIRVISVPFSKDGKKYTLQVGSSMKPVMRIMQDRLFYLAVSIPFVLAAGAALIYYFMTKSLRPVEEISRTAKAITHEDLSSRIGTEKSDEEFINLIRSFNDMISRLEISFRHISEFSSNVAHELKTPIAIVRGEAEVALRKERTPEEYRRVIKICRDETHRIRKTIEDLLLLARLDFRPELYNFERVNLHDFMNDIFEQAGILAEPKHISVTKDFDETDIFLDVDKIHLRRLFFNLIDNAIKFTPRNGRIYIIMKKDENTVKISVRDTGIGIDGDDLPKIFDKFFHVDRSGDLNETGNGLGLSIVQSIARIHKGSVKVSSQVDRGATFTATFPLS